MRKLDEQKYKTLLSKARRYGGNHYISNGVPSGIVYALQQFVYLSKLYEDDPRISYENIFCHLENFAVRGAVLPDEKLYLYNQFGAKQIGLFSLHDVAELDKLIGTGVWTRTLSKEYQEELIGKYLYTERESRRVNSQITNPVKSVECQHGRCFIKKEPDGVYVFDKKEIIQLLKTGKFTKRYDSGETDRYILTAEKPYDYYKEKRDNLKPTDITQEWLEENGFEHYNNTGQFIFTYSFYKKIGDFQFKVRTYKEGSVVCQIDCFYGDKIHFSLDIDKRERLLRLIDFMLDDNRGRNLSYNALEKEGFTRPISDEDRTKSMSKNVGNMYFLINKNKDGNWFVFLIHDWSNVNGFVNIKTQKQLKKIVDIFTHEYDE